MLIEKKKTKSGEPQVGATHTNTKPLLPRRKFVDGMPDKGLFGFVAIVGFAVIIAMKIYLYDSDTIAALAVFLMLAYGIIAYRIPEVHIRLDRLGDNFYYLGFIFTLASMSAALIQLRSSHDIDVILGSFGIALFSTIVGVAGRVLFTQMRSEIDDLEAVIRRDLVETSNELRAQLSMSLRDFETFQKSISQAAEEVHGSSSSIFNEQISKVGDAAQAAAGKIDSAFKENQRPAESLIKAIDKVVNTVEEFSVRLSKMELPNKKIDEQFYTIFGGFEQVLSKTSGSLNDLSERISAIKIPAEKINNQLESVGEKIEQRLLKRLSEVIKEIESQKRPWWSLKRR